MSRSRRHLPITGISSAPSEKDDKRRWNRDFRKRARRMLRTVMDYDALTFPVHIGKETQLWAGAKDGKRWRRYPWPQLWRK